MFLKLLGYSIVVAVGATAAPANSTVGNIRQSAVLMSSDLVNGFHLFSNPCHTNQFSFVSAVMTKDVGKAMIPSVSRIFSRNVDSEVNFVLEAQKYTTNFKVVASSNSKYPVFFTVSGPEISAGNGDPMTPRTEVHYTQKSDELLNDIIKMVKVKIVDRDTLNKPEFICWTKK
ncbi:hypothetical protein BB559_004014 [Furculomyces boomerangus]|uniref:Uncharacterized protein n=2 Tax=Harpellales TaxID=61421 RepID=A0A2T9YHB2_9FUNG|nr:hypothetical protein BB559_004014 [Furculomyces boomerangus]PVZ98045.1 hypothetical protein BB558_005968 [Smittium angustum]PVZ98197.1 hypothetical protein BB558_005826 [Smittium angustum]